MAGARVAWVAWIVLGLGCAPASGVIGSGNGDGNRNGDDDGDGDDDGSAGTSSVCDPVAVPAVLDVVEGDPIELELSCGAPGAALADFVAACENPPQGALWNDGAWTFIWTPDLDQAGVWRVLFSVAPAAAASGDGMPETAVAELRVADAWNAPGNEEVDPESYEQEWNLPVLHIDPVGPLTESYAPAQVVWKGHAHSGAEVKKRGAASLGYPRPGLTLRFDDDDQIDLDEQGLGNKDHLVLLTTFDDNSYVRLKLTFDLWAATVAHWGREGLIPRTFFVVLYLDGEYNGLFVGVDRIDDEFADQMGLSRDGNIYKSVNHDANFDDVTPWGEPKSYLWQGYEKEEGQPEQGQPGAFADLEELVAFSAYNDTETFVEGAPEYFDVEEFMDWFALVHYSEADDSGGKNAYLYNDPKSPGFRYVPWDFNESWGQDWRTQRLGSDSTNDFRWANRIFMHLQDHPETGPQLWDRFFELTETGPMQSAWLLTKMNEYEAELGGARWRDWGKWGNSYMSYGGWAWDREQAGDWTDPDGEWQYVIDWIVERDAWVAWAH